MFEPRRFRYRNGVLSYQSDMNPECWMVVSRNENYDTWVVLDGVMYNVFWVAGEPAVRATLPVAVECERV